MKIVDRGVRRYSMLEYHREFAEAERNEAARRCHAARIVQKLPSHLIGECGRVSPPMYSAPIVRAAILAIRQVVAHGGQAEAKILVDHPEGVMAYHRGRERISLTITTGCPTVGA